MPAGEGGAIVTNDPEFFDACFSYHNCGRVRNGKWYEHHRLGSNLRMSALNAAVLIPQFDTLATDMVIRDRNREMLDASLSEIPGINPMASIDGSRSANHLYIAGMMHRNSMAFPGKRFLRSCRLKVFTLTRDIRLYIKSLFSLLT
ncbi:MAG: hypothetical protein Ct9H300mP9_5300 [Candidatus Neomarinimicrobiota bacterium]|nr:MAG: hypothetical protein Ct9H300mP9_5300 [Candidatus Neomarinimicrobiota bacterium]